MEEWPTVRFGDVVQKMNGKIDLEERAGKRCVQGGHLSRYCPILVKSKTADGDYLGPAFHRTFESGDILFATRFPNLNKVGVPNFDGICANTTLVLRAKSSLICQEFIPCVMKSSQFVEFCILNTRGSTNPYINWTQLAEYEFSLPPLHVQQKITQILHCVDASIAAKYEAIELIGVTKRKVFSKHIDSNMSLEKIRFQDTWARSPEGGHTPKAVKVETGFFVLTLASLGRDGFVDGERKPCVGSEEHQKYILNKGDFLISRSNTVELVGRCGIVPRNMSDTSFGDLFLRITFEREKLLPAYAMYLLQSTFGIRFIRSIAAGTSGSMKKINRKNLADFLIPKVPVNKQLKVVNELDSIEKVRRKTAIENQHLLNVRSELISTMLRPMGVMA